MMKLKRNKGEIKGEKGEKRKKWWKREKKQIRGKNYNKSDRYLRGEKDIFSPNLNSTYLGEKYHFERGGGRE